MFPCSSKDINQNQLKFRSAKEMARQRLIHYDLSSYFQNCNLRGGKKEKEAHPHHMVENVIKSNELFVIVMFVFFF